MGIDRVGPFLPYYPRNLRPMRSQVAKRILSKTPEDVRIFTRLYGDIIVRIHELLKEKGLSQKDLAIKMGKSPSEISKWLNGEHNLTLRSIAKLQAHLGEAVIVIPQKEGYTRLSGKKIALNAPIHRIVSGKGFQPASISKNGNEMKVAS